MVEHNLAKVRVAGPSPVFRSLKANSCVSRCDLTTRSPGGGMVDALVSGTSVSNNVQVRVLFWAPALREELKKWRSGGIGRRATLRG